MNAWLWGAAALAAGLLPLLVVAVRRPIRDGLIALEVAGTDATLVLLALSVGLERQAFVDLALVLGVATFAGAIAFVRFFDLVD